MNTFITTSIIQSPQPKQYLFHPLKLLYITIHKGHLFYPMVNFHTETSLKTSQALN